MANNEIKLKITIDGKDANAIINLTDDNVKELAQSFKKVSKESQSTSDNIVNSFTRIRNTVQGFKEAFDVFKQFLSQPLNLAAELSVLKDNFAGTAKDLELFKQATAGTVSEANLIKLSNQATDLGLSLKQQAIFFSLAEDAGDKYGGSLESNFQKIVAASEGSGKSLKALGIQKEIYDQIVKDLAKAYNAEINELDAETQKQIRLQAILKASGISIESIKNKTIDNKDAIEQFNVKIEELQTQIGSSLSTAFTPLIKELTSIFNLLNNTGAGGIIGSLGLLAGTFVSLRVTGIMPALSSLKLFGEGLFTLRGALLASGIGIILAEIGYGLSKIAELQNNIKKYEERNFDATSMTGKTKEERKWLIEDAKKQQEILEKDIKLLEKKTNAFGYATEQDFKDLQIKKQQFEHYKNVIKYNQEPETQKQSTFAGLGQTKSKADISNTSISKKDMYIHGVDEATAKSMADIFISEDIRRFTEFKNIKELEIKVAEEAAYAKLRVEQDTNEMIQQTVSETERTKLEMAQGTLQNIASLFAQHTVAYKVFSIAQATIDTYKAATAALGTPPVGPWNIAFAASIIAAGLANVAKIISTKVGFAQGGLLPAGKAGIVEGWHNEIIAPEKTFVDVFKSELRPKIYNQLGQDNNIDKIINKLDNWQKEITFKIKGNDLVTSYDRNKNNQLIYSY